jgi:hypothetical protein
MRYLPTVLGTALAVALGGAAVVYGEADDSPGLQLIGALVAIAAVTVGVRSLRHSKP